jgi:hypothetical protein
MLDLACFITKAQECLFLFIFWARVEESTILGSFMGGPRMSTVNELSSESLKTGGWCEVAASLELVFILEPEWHVY